MQVTGLLGRIADGSRGYALRLPTRVLALDRNVAGQAVWFDGAVFPVIATGLHRGGGTRMTVALNESSVPGHRDRAPSRPTR